MGIAEHLPGDVIGDRLQLMEGGLQRILSAAPTGTSSRQLLTMKWARGRASGRLCSTLSRADATAIRDSSMKVTSTSLSRASRESPSTPLPHPRSITLRALWMGRLSSMKRAPISRLVRENTLAWLWMSMSVPSSGQTVGKGLVRDGRSAAGVQ